MHNFISNFQEAYATVHGREITAILTHMNQTRVTKAIQVMEDNLIPRKPSIYKVYSQQLQVIAL